jgi:hypothetical protein
MNTCFKRLSVSATIPKVGFLRGLAVAAVILFAFPIEGRAQLAAPDLKEYRARIVEIYGDKAIVEVDDRRFLVEPVQQDKPFPAEIGADIRIVGQVRENVLVPSMIILPSGSAIQRQTLDSGTTGQPADARNIEGQLRKHKIEAVGRPYRRRNSTVVEGRADDGRKVIALFDSGLRLEEIEEAEHRHIHPRSPEALPEAEVARLVAERGYSSVRLIDQNRFQFLYSVSDSQGQRMELLVDRGGNILRRVWRR